MKEKKRIISHPLSTSISLFPHHTPYPTFLFFTFKVSSVPNKILYKYLIIIVSSDLTRPDVVNVCRYTICKFNIVVQNGYFDFINNAHM